MSSENLTAAERLLKEPLERILGRLSPDQKQALAYQWANRCVKTLAATHLDAAGLKAEAGRMRAFPDATDEASATRLRESVRGVHEASDAARLKEEAAAGGVTEGPCTQAAKATSLANEAVKASLGEAGMKVKVSSGATAAAPKAVVNLDGNLSRAMLAGRHAVLLARMAGDASAADEELKQKQDAMAILKAPRRI
jgi:hypothetical protein